MCVADVCGRQKSEASENGFSTQGYTTKAQLERRRERNKFLREGRSVDERKLLHGPTRA